MIVSRTPMRVSLFGGGSDFPQWTRGHGGSCLGFSINKYCYISIRKLPPFFDYKHRIVYSKIELAKDIDEIQHPAVREVLKLEGIRTGLEIHHDGDLPARSGLGTSSSFAVGMLNAVHALKGHMTSEAQLAEQAIFLERHILNENVGSQDQIFAAYGGMQHIVFDQEGYAKVNPVILTHERRQELLSSLMLFFTGFSRFGSEIAGRQIENIGNREQHLERMSQLTNHAIVTLSSPHESTNEIGHLLHENWCLKRELADGVTTAEIDAIYEAGREAGATGGKLLGAGGGGFMLFFCKPEAQGAVRRRLKDLIEVSFDVAETGSSIVLYHPNGL